MAKEYKYFVFEIIIGGIIGFFLLHPVSMLITSGWKGFVLCFENNLHHLFHSPMALYFSLIGMVMAFISAYSRLRIKRKNYLLEVQKIEIQKNVELLNTTLDELNKLNQTKDKFFSIIAHDLRNPFSTIICFSEMIIKNYQKYDTEKMLHFIENIKLSSTTASHLLENLLIWSRSKVGSIEFNPKVLNLSEVVMNNISIVQLQALKKEIKIHFDDINEWLCSCDENMLNTILRNLLTNAVKFTDTAGSITIVIENEPDFYKISITDTGIGISQEKLVNLFRTEFNCPSVGTDNEKGSGLGLLLCKEFVEKHDGNIWCESILGEGSIFNFTLKK